MSCNFSDNKNEYIYELNKNQQNGCYIYEQRTFCTYIDTIKINA